MDVLIVMFYVIALFMACGKGQSGDDVRNLTDQLFTKNGYKKSVRPNRDQTEAMEVYVDLCLTGINGIDEVEQKLTTTGYLVLDWVDEYLQWDPESYGDLDFLYISQSDIWKPDITLLNGFSKINELGNSFINVYIEHTGDVRWAPTDTFKTKCSIDITYFPFDRQSCNITFVVWLSSILDIIILHGDEGIILNNLDSDATWTVISTSSAEDLEADDTTVTFNIILERNGKYYVTNVIIPVIFLAMLSVVTFVIPSDCGEKMGYSITVFLSFAVFLTIVSDQLPKTSGSILGNYLLFQLGLGAFVVTVTAFEIRLHYRKKKVPELIVKLFLFRCRNKTKPYSASENETNHKKIDWGDVVSVLDAFLFFTTLLIELVVTAVVYNILATKYS